MNVKQWYRDLEVRTLHLDKNGRLTLLIKATEYWQEADGTIEHEAKEWLSVIDPEEWNGDLQMFAAKCLGVAAIGLYR